MKPVLVNGCNGPAPRLLCLPWAGGVAESYAAWRDALHPVKVVPLELPGRGRRYWQTPLRNWRDAIDMIGQQAREYKGPVILFGHSMGAVLAYEVARLLENEFAAPPAGLILSGAAAPHHRRESLSSTMSDRALATSLVNAGGTPREILDDPEFLVQYLSVLRADLCLLESYRWLPGPAVTCPVCAIAGRSDPHAPPDGVRAWSEYVSGSFEFRDFKGGHFYFKSQPVAFLTHLRCFLSGCESRFAASRVA